MTPTSNYTQRSKHKWNSYLDKESFIGLTDALRLIGFKDLKVKLPIHRFTSNGSRKWLTVEEFISIKSNFSAIILTAENEEEKVEIVFKNDYNDKIVFWDDVYPSISDLRDNIYIVTKDPLRASQISNFIKDYLEKYRVWAYSIRANLSFTAIFIPILLLFPLNNVAKSLELNSKLVAILSIPSLIVAFILGGLLMFSIAPKAGVYIYKAEKAMAKRPLWWLELKKQWLVIIVTVILAWVLAKITI